MNMKKLFLLNLPYLLFVYPFDKLAQAFRLAPGADLSGKLLSIGDGLTAALSSPWLSFHPTDLLIGIAGAVVLRMAVYLKGKNAKKYRHGIEYGSARWGTAADIAPYSVLVQSIATDGNISGAIWACMGYTVLLCFALFKTGSLSKSLFGAH